MIRRIFTALLIVALCLTGLVALATHSDPFFWEIIDTKQHWVRMTAYSWRVSIYHGRYNYDGSRPWLQHTLRPGGKLQHAMLHSGVGPGLRPLTGTIQTLGFDRPPSGLSHVRFVSVPFWMPAVMFGAPAVALMVVPRTLRLALHQRRRRRGLCVRCGYDLTGNDSGVCPECGEAV